MTVEQAISLLNCTRQELADTLGVSKVSVSQWAKRGSVPLAREYQVRDLMAGRKPIMREQQVA
jgi:DNA-binding transcriptional regulator YdaS (Cro superfamily)